MIKLKKVVISDYDGTLFQNETVSQEDLDAIHRLRASGGLFGIATGRIVGSIKAEIDKYNIPVDFLVGVNGALVLNKDYEVKHSTAIDKIIAKDVLSYLTSNDTLFHGISDGFGIFIEGPDSYLFEKQYKPYDESLKNDIHGIYAKVHSRDDSFRMSHYINQNFGDHVKAMPNFSNLDVVSVKTDKLDAILKVIDSLGDVEVTTTGDAHNDYKMLKHFNGYVMRHGDPEIVSKIDRKTSSVSAVINVVLGFDN